MALRDEPVDGQDKSDATAQTPCRQVASDRPSDNAAGETPMRTTIWPGLGSLPVKLTLGLVIAAALSAALPVRAGELHGCAGSHAAAHTATPARPAPATSSHRSYLTAVRMGWA